MEAEKMQLFIKQVSAGHGVHGAVLLKFMALNYYG